MSGSANRVRSRVRTQWLALGAALVVLASVLVGWALTQAADRVQVVQVAQSVRAGDVIAAADLSVADVAFDGQVQGLVPVASLDALVGRIATIDLQPGTLMQVGMWSDVPQLAKGEEAVGALLAAGLEEYLGIFALTNILFVLQFPYHPKLLIIYIPLALFIWRRRV